MSEPRFANSAAGSAPTDSAPTSDATAGTAGSARVANVAHPSRVVSFVRRSGRMSHRHERSWNAYREQFLVEVPRGETGTSVDPAFRIDVEGLFGRTAPLIVEIGSGQGDAIIAAAAEHPEWNFLAIEVYTPGLAQTIHRAHRNELTNIRLIQANAPEVLAAALPAGSVDELWVFFPDPWHKSRHHKRRLVAPPFARLAGRVLRRPGAGNDGGLLRLATDWADYAQQMTRVLDAEQALENEYGPGAAAPRFEGRALTGFERKALAAGRAVVDLTYRRR